MTKREAVISALEHREVRPVPWSVSLTLLEQEILCSHYSLAPDALQEMIGSYITSCDVVSAAMEDMGNERYRDYFGVVWNRSGPDKDIGVVEGAVIPEPEAEYITLPAVPEAEIRRDLAAFCAKPTETFRVANFGFSLFERFWTLRGGLEYALMDFVAEPEFTKDLFDAITDFNLRCLDIILEYPVDAVLFGDDWGQQKGLIMGPAHWRNFIRPCLAAMYGKVHAAGKFVLQHSCGDISDVYPDLIGIGLNAHQTFQPEIFDVDAMKAQFGDRLTFWGAISTQRLLPFATPGEVAEETKRLISFLGSGGGYIAAPTHAVPYDVPAENFDAMLKVFHDQPVK